MARINQFFCGRDFAIITVGVFNSFIIAGCSEMALTMSGQ